MNDRAHARQLSGRATITMREAAEILGVDARTVSGAVRAGDIPAVRVGRRVLIPRHRFFAYLDGNGDAAAEEPPAPNPPADSAAALRARLLAVLLDSANEGLTT